jgi:F-type H+-transporting ATPase subunit delta
VIDKTLAKRYAAALLRVTDPEGSTEEVEQMLLALKEAYHADKALRDILSQPRVPKALKKSILRKPFEGRARPSFLEFLSLLVDKNRQTIIPDIADMFDRLADASRGIVRVQVRSWKPLSEPHRSALQGKLERLVGKKIELEARSDPALKGGMLVLVGDTVIDGSVAQRLKALGEKFREMQRR